jgi:hypothetical protein
MAPLALEQKALLIEHCSEQSSVEYLFVTCQEADAVWSCRPHK